MPNASPLRSPAFLGALYFFLGGGKLCFPAHHSLSGPPFHSSKQLDQEPWALMERKSFNKAPASHLLKLIKKKKKKWLPPIAYNSDRLVPWLFNLKTISMVFIYTWLYPSSLNQSKANLISEIKLLREKSTLNIIWQV